MITARTWRFKNQDGSEYVDIAFNNDTGSPIEDVDLDDAWALPGVYTITASAVVAGVTATFTVAIQDAVDGQVYEGRVKTLVPIDGATIVSDVIPGVRFRFSDSGSFTNGWSATVYVGLWAGLLRAGNPNGTQYRYITGTADPDFDVDAGDPGALWRIRVYNEGSTARSYCKLVLYKTPVVFDLAGPRGFSLVMPTSDNPVELTGTGGVLKPYHLIWTVVDDGEDIVAFTVDPHPFGAPVAIDLRDIDAAENVTSAAVVRGASYQVRNTGGTTSKLADLLLDIGDDVDATTRTNVVIVGKRHLYLAEDLGGAIPTVWVQDEIPLTETGETEGNVGSGNFSYAFLKLDVGALASNLQNPFCQRPIVESDNLGLADFLDTP